MYTIMVRTQIYLPEDLHKELLLAAARDNTTLSELIRSGARKVLLEKRKKDKSGEVLASIANLHFKGPKDLSKNHTKYYVEAVLAGSRRG